MAKSTTEQGMQAGDENAVVLEKDAAEPGETEVGDVETEPSTLESAATSTGKRGRRARRSPAADATDGGAEAGTAATTRRGRRATKSRRTAADGAAADSATSDSATSKASATDGAPRTPVLPRVIGGLLVLAVLLGAVLVVQLIKGPGNGGKLVAQEDRSQDARQQANTMIPKLYSYDYRQIDANVNEQLQLTTGTINDQIRTQTGPALKQLAPKVKAVVQAVSLDSAVIDDSKPDIQVLVYLNQAVNSSLLPAPRLDRNRVVATMRLVNGQWKVADIKAL